MTPEGRNQHIQVKAWRLREVKGLTQGPLSEEVGYGQHLAPEFSPGSQTEVGRPGEHPPLPCPALLGDLRHTACEVDAAQVL